MQKDQQTNTSNTTNVQNRLVNLRQGNPFSSIYRIYQFEPLTEIRENSTVAKEYSEIAKEFLTAIYKNNVISIEAAWKKIKLEKRDFFDRWTLPVFIEDGKMQQLKRELKDGKWGELLWGDYMSYEEDDVTSIFLHIPRKIRFYWRMIFVLQEKIDITLLDRMCECGFEQKSVVAIKIFPHPKIKTAADDKATIHNYAQSDDYIVMIAYCITEAFISIELNHNYMNYEQMLELTEPLFEKRGIKIKDKTEPYIRANFPPDYIKYDEHPCAGYEFID